MIFMHSYHLPKLILRVIFGSYANETKQTVWCLWMIYYLIPRYLNHVHHIGTVVYKYRYIRFDDTLYFKSLLNYISHWLEHDPNRRINEFTIMNLHRRKSVDAHNRIKSFPFPGSLSLTWIDFKFWELISHFILHFIMDVITYPCLENEYNHAEEYRVKQWPTWNMIQ